MAIDLGVSSRVTIFGGSGFLGRHVVQAIAKTGARMLVGVRRPGLAGHLQPLGGVGQIYAVQANVRYPDSLIRAAEGADVVINLTGILAPGGKQSFKAVHDEGARNVAEAAKKAGAKSFIHVSAIGADPKSDSAYARTKAAGEEAVREVMPDAVIFRPSVVFGPEDEFFNRFAAMARISPALPLIGGGHTKLQPVFVGDVAKAVLAGISSKAKAGKIYELGGPEVLSMKEIMQLVLLYTERKRLLVNLPFWLANLQAQFLQWLPNPPLTPDQVRMLRNDNVVSAAAIKDGRTLDGLNIREVPISAVVPDYLERFRPRGQFSPYPPAHI
ncbi:complex I NDUFA9 subunit family protein [Methyloligella sp. 2.7D]|uniref:complex I NDUFA9 subunit family protein n=1 Tax=unclassified Methyloligella TaxID=2625955 RepID=UPI00157D9B94|nr:complex I NDUFA9 subunit family protein [Methyloligella sp. GL2]QKP76077.1 complex I NDUFA9 subunit family protein [Methyloligella sp. GL2]